MAEFIPLKTDFKDDILAESNAKRKYQQTFNADGSVSLDDVTQYQQEGDALPAAELNKTNTAINKIYSDRIVNLDDLELVTEPGFFVDALVVKNALAQLNVKLERKTFTKEEFHFQSFYTISEFDAYSENSECYIYLSALANATTFGANTKYDFNTASIPQDMIPESTVVLNGIITGSRYDNPGICTLVINTDGTMHIYSSISASNKWIKLCCRYSKTVTHF